MQGCAQPRQGLPFDNPVQAKRSAGYENSKLNRMQYINTVLPNPIRIAGTFREDCNYPLQIAGAFREDHNYPLQIAGAFREDYYHLLQIAGAFCTIWTMKKNMKR
jgi:hypothetical protein